MYKYYVRLRLMLFCLCLIFSFSSSFAQNTTASPIDLQKAKPIIENLDRQFAQYYFNGDSVALYNMYAKDGSFGSLKGNDILLYWGKGVRNSIKNDTRNIQFTTTSLSADEEFLVELGYAEVKDSKGNLKHKGKYVVVWKQEDGTWKLFRDIGL